MRPFKAKWSLNYCMLTCIFSFNGKRKIHSFHGGELKKRRRRKREEGKRGKGKKKLYYKKMKYNYLTVPTNQESGEGNSNDIYFILFLNK